MPKKSLSLSLYLYAGHIVIAIVLATNNESSALTNRLASVKLEFQVARCRSSSFCFGF